MCDDTPRLPPSVPYVEPVTGSPGAGKTFLLQQIAAEATTRGLPVAFIGAKGTPPEA